MRAARIRVTAEALSKMMRLPEGAEIVSAIQDADDIFHRSVSFVIRGAGEECIEGSAVKVMSIDDLMESCDG